MVVVEEHLFRKGHEAIEIPAFGRGKSDQSNRILIPGRWPGFRSPHDPSEKDVPRRLRVVVHDHQNNASKIKKALGCAYRSHLNDAESVSYVCCAAKKKSTRRSDHILGVHHGCQILKMTTFRDNETTLVVTIRWFLRVTSAGPGPAG